MNTNEIDIITLGCSKNLVDAERLMYQLTEAGYRCCHDSDDPHGEIAVINTCGFIGDAKEESINTILQFAQRKRRHQLRRLYVMGCLSQRYLSELQKEIPEVDRFYGKFNFLDLINDLKQDRPGNLTSCQDVFRRTITTPAHYAYLKIAEGCNRFCSYCAIPIITGRYKSRPIEEIEDEVRWLTSQGVKELQVIAQDLTNYGEDLYGENKIAQLIDNISRIPGVEWIRLHYAYPTHFPLDLLRVMRERDNVCKYLDIALQHSSDHMLSLMHRHITKDEQTQLINTIRQEVPGIFLRTTLMVGHPGETPEDFQDLMQYTQTMHFERMGAFAYSDEEGTYCNLHYNDDIPTETKNERLNRLMDLQQQIAEQVSRQLVGQTLKVIIDREDDDFYYGRTQYDSPEVDGEVLISKQKDNLTPLSVGQFYQVRITDSDIFDLYGEVQQ